MVQVAWAILVNKMMIFAFMEHRLAGMGEGGGTQQIVSKVMNSTTEKKE